MPFYVSNALGVAHEFPDAFVHQFPKVWLKNMKYSISLHLKLKWLILDITNLELNPFNRYWN